MKKHDRSGPHHVALAMWVSNGQKSFALGTLPPHVRDGVLTAFRAVYQGEKSEGSLRDFPGDLSMIELSGGNVLPGYRSRFSARGILAAIAVPFRNTQGAIIQSAEYLALASDSATDRAAHKSELVYYRTMFEGKPRTAFLSCQALPNGTASGIFSSYKRAFTAAGLEVTDWIPKLVWYCADGATVMQGRSQALLFHSSKRLGSLDTLTLHLGIFQVVKASASVYKVACKGIYFQAKSISSLYTATLSLKCQSHSICPLWPFG